MKNENQRIYNKDIILKQARPQPLDFNHFQSKRDFLRYLTLARNSFAKGKFDLASDYCRQITANGVSPNIDDIILEAYYLWCLANLNLRRSDDVKRICYEARTKFGNYLDLVYFELTASAISCDFEKVMKFSETFLEILEEPGSMTEPKKSRTAEKYADVLIMYARALADTGQTELALKYYEQYLNDFEDNGEVRNSIDEIKKCQGMQKTI